LTRSVSSHIGFNYNIEPEGKTTGEKSNQERRGLPESLVDSRWSLSTLFSDDRDILGPSGGVKKEKGR